MKLGESIFRNELNPERELSPEDSLRLFYLDTQLAPNNDFYWYLEPVEVDTYVHEESRFEVKLELLVIKLPPVPPLEENFGDLPGMSKKIFDDHLYKDEPIMLMDILTEYPELQKALERSYSQYYKFLEHFQRQYQNFKEGNDRALEIAVYLTETLLKFEPTVMSLRYLGDVHTFNLNMLIAKMNQKRVLVNLELDTVQYLIKRCDLYGGDYATDSDYQELSAIFLHKAKYEY